MSAKNASLTVSFISSFVIHISALLLASTVAVRNVHLHRNLIPVTLIELSHGEPAPVQHPITLPQVKKTPPLLSVHAEKPAINELTRIEPSARPTTTPMKEEPTKAAAKEPDAPAKTALEAHAEGLGSETKTVIGKSDIGLVPGLGTVSSGGGTAVSSLGRRPGAPGLPAQSVLQTNREAKPIQTARASYPPMALRMGMEGDVTLRIEVDSQGNVTKAEIIKSAGAGFDEEALKAIKLSRFEPAQKDGQNVAAEFTYMYRFRLQR